jgi:hypothetical protein
MMRILKIPAGLLLSMLVFCGYAQGVLADRPAPPRDYSVASPDGQTIFVMLAPDDRPSRHDPDLRAMYPRPGMYRKADRTVPLWTVDWYQQEVTPADATHVIRWGPWAESTNDPALTFYTQDRAVKQYRVRELVCDESGLGHTVSHINWRAAWSLDSEQGVLSLQTLDGQSHRFRVNTGEPLDGGTPCAMP